MSHNPKKANKEMEKAIFIAADCWLEVFDLLPPAQLGLGIALISRRFDYFVDEHFKTRKWKLGRIVIRHKIGENGAKEMQIVNSKEKSLPIPQNPLPNKVIGFRAILIFFIDQNVLIFLHHFHRFFATFATNLAITTLNVRISKFAVLTIWPMFKDTIRLLYLNTVTFRQMRQLAPSLLNDCPSLRIVNFFDGISLEFPPDDSANASDGQAVAKWLFTPRPDNFPKELICVVDSTMEQWLTTVEQIKAAFFIASSPLSFGISVCFPPSVSLSAVLPFELTNEFTGEKLALSQNANTEHGNAFVLKRRPIAAGNEKKWLKDLHELIDGQKNKIEIFIRDDEVDDGLLDDLPGPSGGDQQQYKMK